jgi:hypothetical protein
MPPTEIVVCLARLGEETKSEVRVMAKRVLKMIWSEPQK